MNLFNTNARKQYPFYLVMTAIALVIWLVLRLVLWVDVGVNQLSISQALKALAIGFWFDLNALCYLAIPFLLASIVVPNSWRSKAWFNKARWLLAFLVTFALLFGAVSEYKLSNQPQ